MRKIEARQFSLPLDLPRARGDASTGSARTDFVAVTEDLLREAWRRSRLRIDFEEAMSWPHFRICLMRVAMALARKGLRK